MVVIGRGNDTVLIGDPVIKGRGLLFLNSRRADARGNHQSCCGERQPRYRPVASEIRFLLLLPIRLCCAHAVLIYLYVGLPEQLQTANELSAEIDGCVGGPGDWGGSSLDLAGAGKRPLLTFTTCRARRC